MVQENLAATADLNLNEMIPLYFTRRTPPSSDTTANPRRCGRAEACGVR